MSISTLIWLQSPTWQWLCWLFVTCSKQRLYANQSCLWGVYSSRHSWLSRIHKQCQATCLARCDFIYTLHRCHISELTLLIRTHIYIFINTMRIANCNMINHCNHRNYIITILFIYLTVIWAAICCHDISVRQFFLSNIIPRWKQQKLWLIAKLFAPPLSMEKYK